MINYKLFATQLGQATVGTTTLNEIEGAFFSLVGNIEYKQFRDLPPLSLRSTRVYNWVMSVASSNLPEEEKVSILRQVAELLLVGEDLDRIQKFLGNPVPQSKRGGHQYVSPGRIEELSSLTNTEFDLLKLITLLKELNMAWSNKCYFSSIMLLRSIIDHVPPIFGVQTFSDVSNHNVGTRSFKEGMERLQSSSRKIADLHLHSKIRNRESISNETQVDFSNDLDLLLAEIIRVLRT